MSDTATTAAPGSFQARVVAVADKAKSAADAPLLSKAGIIEAAVGELLEVLHDMAAALDRVEGGEHE